MNEEKYSSTLYIEEYGILSQRLTSLETWVPHFVTFFYTINVALIAALGFLVLGQNQQNIENSQNPLPFEGVEPFICGAGIISCGWLVAFLVYFYVRQNIILRRMSDLEILMYSDLHAEGCIVHRRNKPKNKRAAQAALMVAGLVIIIVLIGWILLFLRTIS